MPGSYGASRGLTVQSEFDRLGIPGYASASPQVPAQSANAGVRAPPCGRDFGWFRTSPAAPTSKRPGRQVPRGWGSLELIVGGHNGALENRQMVHQPLVLPAGGSQERHLRAEIKIHDVTLRDGEQQTAVVFRREEKVAIARQLDALGVHRIEAGMPAVSEQDKAAISDIAALG